MIGVKEFGVLVRSEEEELERILLIGRGAESVNLDVFRLPVWIRDGGLETVVGFVDISKRFLCNTVM